MRSRVDFDTDKHQHVNKLANDLEAWAVNRERKGLDTVPLRQAIALCDVVLRERGYTRERRKLLDPWESGTRYQPPRPYRGDPVLVDPEHEDCDHLTFPNQCGDVDRP